MGKLFILKNIDEAIRLVTEQPPELFDLAVFRRKLDCGTLHCTAGLLCSSAHFRALGWEWDVNWVTIQDEPIDESTTLDTQFGGDAFNSLFTYRGASPYDADKDAHNRTDKDLALRRLRIHRTVMEAL